METVGAYLKSAREKKDKSIQELAATTRISKSVLEAIEEDRDEMLPPMSYFKGFLRIYAKELGLDPDETISLYDMALKEKRWEPQKELKEDKQSRRRKKIRIAVAVVVGLAAALLLCFVLRDAGSPGALQQSAAVSAAPAVQPDAVRTVPAEPPVAVQPIPPVAAQPPQTPVTAEPVKREAPAASENRAEPGRDVIPSPAAQLTVRFVAHELSWIQLTVDDREPFDIMLRAGESYRQRAAERIRLRLGNAGGLVLFYNGRRLVPPGEAGKPVNLVLPRDVEKLLQPPPSMEPQEP